MNAKANPHVRSSAAFTLVEMLTVIAIIGIVAALVVSMGKYAAATRIKTRADAGKHGLIMMIDSYHDKLSYYPPDNGNLANPNLTPAAYDGLAATNPLFYELTGVTNTNNGANFFVYNINNCTTVSASDYSRVFGTNRGGVANADAVEPHNFYQPFPAPKDCAPYFQGTYQGNPEAIYGLLVPAQLATGNTNNFWHYDSSSANRHNMSSYDLWAEYTVGSVTNTNGNW
jgi:prepilin-type N-terminal cleavage/methylation domain-containing protein